MIAPCAGLGFLLACAVCVDVYAAGDLAIRAGRLNFDVQEFDTRDDRLVHESGPLYGIEVNAGFRRRQAEIQLDASYYSGDVDYNGQTQAKVPVNSSTREQLVDVSLTAVYHLLTAPVPGLTLYAGPGFRHWYRDIQSVGGVSGLDEVYRWWTLQTGLQAGWERKKNRWTLDGRLIRAMGAKVDVDLGAGFDSAELNTGDGWGWRLSGRWSRALSPRIEAALDLFYERQELGKSEAEPLKSGGMRIGSIFQPRIEMKNFGILIGLRRTW